MLWRNALTIVVAAICLASKTRGDEMPPFLGSESRAFLRNHCHDCHADGVSEGGLDLERLGTHLADPGPLSKWVRIFDRIEQGEMPPSEMPPPPEVEKRQFLTELCDVLRTASSARAETVLRRLNRVEYENTLNDLLGTKVSMAEMLPEDGTAHGFDNIGEALDISPVQLRQYMQAAGLALDAAVQHGPRPESKVETYTFDTGRNEGHVGRQWGKRPDGAVVFFLDGGFPAIKVHEFRVQTEGRYRFRIHAAAHRSERPVTFAVYLGEDTFRNASVLFDHFEAAPGDFTVQEFEADLRRGDTLRLMVRGLRNTWAEVVNGGVDQFDGPGLAVQRFEVEGPFFDQWPGQGHRLRFGDLTTVDVGPEPQRHRPNYRPRYVLRSEQPESDFERLLPPFVEAAFRRPVSEEEVAPFIGLAKAELHAGAEFEQALRTAHVAVLCSPDFLYLWESPGELDDFALASRLSYMLWGTLPDAGLLSQASNGELSRPEVLRAETERLLDDPKARRLTRNFVGQWLNLREIDFTNPDQRLYPEFDDLLKQAIVQETELFFEEVLRENLSLLDFVDSDWTMLNERLAGHYGIDGVEGVAMRKVPLRGEHRRGGVLTHASVLKVSADGTTTSPIVRGAYVLERILGITPPPPPPDIAGVEPDIRGATTLRELLDKHRSDMSCNACHRLIDPPGFALEHYDVIGGWRENYRSLSPDFDRPSPEQTGGRGVRWRVGPPVDASGITPEGDAFADLAEYKRLLLADPDRLAYALAEKLATYGTGRGMGFADRDELERIVQQVADREYGFRDLLHAVVQSRLFRHK